MASHQICSKVDRALVAYLISVNAGTDADVLPAKKSLSKTLPCTICWSHSASPPQGDPYSGNRTVEAFVEVRTSGVIEENQADDTPWENSIDRYGQTSDAFAGGDGQSSEELAAAITTAARSSADTDLKDLTIIACRMVLETQGFNPRNPRELGQTWVDAIHLEILAACSDVS